MVFAEITPFYYIIIIIMLVAGLRSFPRIVIITIIRYTRLVSSAYTYAWVRVSCDAV